MYRKQRRLQELTIGGRDNRGVQFLLYIAEELSTVLHVPRSPKLVVNIDCAQSLRLRFFKSVLPVPNHDLLLHRVTQMVWAIDRVRLGAFDVRLCIVEPAFTAKQPCPRIDICHREHDEIRRDDILRLSLGGERSRGMRHLQRCRTVRPYTTRM